MKTRQRILLVLGALLLAAGGLVALAVIVLGGVLGSLFALMMAAAVVAAYLGVIRRPGRCAGAPPMTRPGARCPVMTSSAPVPRVRRRLFGGMIAVVASLLLLIIVPLVPLASHWGGVAVWLVLAGAGLVAIVAAALLDTTRSAIQRRITRLTELTHDWE